MMRYNPRLKMNHKLRFVGVALLIVCFSGHVCSGPSLAQQKESTQQKESAQEKESTESAEKSAGEQSKQEQVDQKKSVAKEEPEQKKLTKKDAAKLAQDNSNKTEKRLDLIESKLDKLVDAVSKIADSKAPLESKETAAKPADLEKAKPAKPAPDSNEKSPTSEKNEPAAKQANTDQKEPAADKPKAEQPAAPIAKLEPEWLKSLAFRSIGPANMAGRVTDLEVHPSDPSLWWIATAGGGILKTENRGTTVEHQFDQQATVSIGAIASDPQDKNILWVGTGEINPRNSVSYGDGVYKSTDGGKTYSNMGLEETYQISSIVIHPNNSDVVYVGALGRLYGTNDARGVYKTIDGGKSWEKVFYLDERTGVIEMIMHPTDPDTLIVGMWDRKRDEFDSWPGSVAKPDGIDGYDPVRKWGPKAGLYKTTDAGKNWKKLTAGLPTGMTGRIGLDWQSKSPNVIFAIIDCEEIGKGPKPFDAFLGLVGQDRDGSPVVTQVMPGSPADKQGFKVGDVLVSADEAKLYQFDELLSVLREKIPGERIKLSVNRGEEILEIAPKLGLRPGTQGSAAEPLYGLVGKDESEKIVLTEVTTAGPADQAGLKAGDTIRTAAGKPLKDYKTWIGGTKNLAVGDQVELGITRGEEELTISVTLGKRLGTGPQSTAVMGIQGADNPQGGAKLTQITKDGPSEKAGLKLDDIVIKVGDKEIKNYNELLAEIRSRQAEEVMPVEVKRGEKVVKLKVVLGDRNTTQGDRPYTYSYFGQRPNVQDQQGSDGHRYGGIYKSTDAGETWHRVNSLNVRPMYFSEIRVDPSDAQRVYVLGVSQFQSKDGGVTFTSDLGRGVHADAHDLWINPNDGRHMVIGCDGGFYVTYDRGSRWDHINTAAIGQFYHVTIAPTKPYKVYGGLQDNGSWGGPAIGLAGGPLNEDWISVGGGDGFVCRVDPEDPDTVYSESQNGSIARKNLRTGAGASIRPPRVEGKSYRFNWNTPFILSNHNSKIFYSAGNYVFRSLDRGDDLQIISPELTKTQRGSGTALSESPLNPNVLYAGTDDGALWVTRDGGSNWTDISDNLGVDPRWVATIEASRFEAGRVYVCLDGHRSDDDRPHVFVSEDFGATFSDLGANLPRGSSRCLREDTANPNLVFLGTEFSFWVSIDRGKNWSQFNQSLPTVAVHEIAMHPEVSEIVLATHGRSLWACDVSPLRSLTPEKLTSEIALLKPADKIRWRRTSRRGGTSRRYVGDNPSNNVQLWYTLPKDVKKATLRIDNIAGEKLAELNGSTKAGLQVAQWNLTQARQTGRASAVPNGDYRITLVIDGKEVAKQVLSVKQDPTLSPDAISEAEFEAVQRELDVNEEEDESGEDKNAADAATNDRDSP